MAATTVAAWTDTNKRVLIDVLMIFSDGRFTSLSNKKAKWESIKEAFNLRTGTPLKI